MFTNLLKYITQPYPVEQRKWRLMIYISVFVSLFILVFQPFGLNEWSSDYKFLILAGYGLVTLIILILDMILLPAIFRVVFAEENWNVWKEIIFLFWILFTVGLGNLIYSSWAFGFYLTFRNVAIFQLFTLAIGLIPITTLTLIKQNYLRKKNETSAGAITAKIRPHVDIGSRDQMIRIASDNEKEAVNILVSDLIYIKSDGNYITVGYFRQGKFSKTMLRNTLKYATDQFSGIPFIYQCHRSWLVNLNRISRVSGNSQGLRIVMEGTGEDIPVARNQVAGFKDRIT